MHDTSTDPTFIVFTMSREGHKTIISLPAPQRTRASYAVELEPKHFCAITQAESDGVVDYHETLSARLEGVGSSSSGREVEGVHSVEYNGHFGSAIYYTVDAEDDTPELHASVTAIITAHIARTTQLLASDDSDATTCTACGDPLLGDPGPFCDPCAEEHDQDDDAA